MEQLKILIIQKKAGKGKQKNENQRGQTENNKMVDLSPNINIFGLNTAIKGQTGYMKKDSIICCLQETYFQYNNIGRLKVKGCKKIHHANTT